MVSGVHIVRMLISVHYSKGLNHIHINIPKCKRKLNNFAKLKHLICVCQIKQCQLQIVVLQHFENCTKSTEAQWHYSYSTVHANDLALDFLTTIAEVYSWLIGQEFRFEQLSCLCGWDCKFFDWSYLCNWLVRGGIPSA